MTAPPKRLDILYVGTLPPQPGGCATVCSQVLVGLARSGHRIRAIAPVTADTLPAAETFAGRHPELAITRFVVPYFEMNPLSLPLTDPYQRSSGAQIQEHVARLVAAAEPDIVVIGRESFAWHVPDLAESYAIPSVLVSHGFPSRAMLDGSYPEALTRQLLERYRKVDVIIAVARHWVDRLRTLGLEHVDAIPNPVDLHRFAPAPKDRALLHALGIGDHDVVVMHAANLKHVKRPLDIVSSASAALPHARRLLYVIVGDGVCREAMEAASRAHGVADRFRFVGWVEHERVPAYLNLADIVVMPSEHETQAMVYLEAQACGRLLLASDIAGAREVIVDGETGLLFRRGDVEDLTAKTLMAARDERLRAVIGGNARDAVRAHSLPTVVAAYAVALARVVVEHGQATACAPRPRRADGSAPAPGDRAFRSSQG